jgi:hypothetical protein
MSVNVYHMSESRILYWRQLYKRCSILASRWHRLLSDFCSCSGAFSWPRSTIFLCFEYLRVSDPVHSSQLLGLYLLEVRVELERHDRPPDKECLYCSLAHFLIYSLLTLLSNPCISFIPNPQTPPSIAPVAERLHTEGASAVGFGSSRKNPVCHRH